MFGYDFFSNDYFWYMIHPVLYMFPHFLFIPQVLPDFSHSIYSADPFHKHKRSLCKGLFRNSPTALYWYS